MSGSVAQLQSGSVLMSNVPVTIEAMQTLEMEGHVGVSGSYCCWGSSDIQTHPLLRTMSGSIVLLWLGSVLKSGSCTATKGHTEA